METTFFRSGAGNMGQDGELTFQEAITMQEDTIVTLELLPHRYKGTCRGLGSSSNEVGGNKRLLKVPFMKRITADRAQAEEVFVNMVPITKKLATIARRRATTLEKLQQPKERHQKYPHRRILEQATRKDATPTRRLDTFATIAAATASMLGTQTLVEAGAHAAVGMKPFNEVAPPISTTMSGAT